MTTQSWSVVVSVASICVSWRGHLLAFKLNSSSWQIRGCLYDIGATFIPARVHSGSLLWLCICLHDTNTKCHAGASHTGASSRRFLCRSEIFIPARKFIPVSCKRGMTVRSYPLKFHQFYGTIRLAPQQTRLYVNRVQLFISPRNESRTVIM